MTKNVRLAKWCFLITCLVIISGCQKNDNAFPNKESGKRKVRVAYFMNITHSQAIVGLSNGVFNRILGDDVEIEPVIFNAGSSEIEALFADEVDIGYIGPSPAVNGYIKSDGKALKIISGAASGGASLVLQKELADSFSANKSSSLVGKKISSPQQGNTQDISLRHYLRKEGLSSKVKIIPMTNADQFTVFKKGDIDGSWSPEPWATRLVTEADGVRVIDERSLWPDKDFCVTNVIVRTKFLEENPDLVKKWLIAHREITKWINDNQEEARNIINNEIEKKTSNRLQKETIDQAWSFFRVTDDPIESSVYSFTEDAYNEGFLGDKKIDLNGIYNLNLDK